MLDKLRAEALALIAGTPRCTLSTTGPAGVQASVVSCMVRDDCLYVLVPSTADHLFNLEHASEISARASSEGHTLVEVFPLRMQIEAAANRRYRETIDFDVSVFHTSPTQDTSS